jgi:phage gp29-like protein
MKTVIVEWMSMIEDTSSVVKTSVADNAEAVALLENHHEVKQAELHELLRTYDVTEAVYEPGGSSYVILSERVNGTTVNTGFPEMGFIDPSPFTAWTRLEHVNELRGRQGIRAFYDMTRNDGAVRGALRIVKTPIQGADWYIEPASESVLDQNIAKFVENNLFEELDGIWEHFIEDCLRSFDYGYFPFEKEYGWSNDGKRIQLKKLIPLHPLDVQGWIYDDKNVLKGLRLEPLNGQDVTKIVEIPCGKMLHIVFEMEAGDLRGTSILRSAYKHWYFKEVLYKIDAIQKERHAVGVPVIKLPAGFTAKDLELANELGRNLRSNERSYITAPFNWEIYFAKLEGQPVDTIPSIEHHDQKIYENILAAFMGSTTVSQESMDTFYKSTRYVAKSMAACINKYVIKELVDINFLRKGGYPKLKVRRMGEWEDLRTMTFALRNLVGARVITPDEKLEAWARDQMDLPEFDKATARDMQQGSSGMTPPGQNVSAPKATQTKQTPTPRIGTPSANSGTDRSGGS